MSKIEFFLAQVTKVDSGSIGVPKVAANDQTFANIVSTTFLVIGGIAVLFLVIGAFRYIISNGDQGSITKAKNTILYAVIGLVISMLAFTIVQFVLGRIFG